MSLWEAGLDYRHGTGHGVGAFLNVHEGPCGIGYRPRPDDMGLEPGMILSDGKYMLHSYYLTQTPVYATDKPVDPTASVFSVEFVLCCLC